MRIHVQLFEHYQQAIKRGELAPEDVPNRQQMAHEWCVSQWTAQWARTLLMDAGLATRAHALAKPLGPISEADMGRFWPRVDAPDENGCMKWKTPNPHGYGRFRLNGRMVPAHRVAYEYLVGPVPEGLELDHSYEAGCRSKLCCWVDHLEPVTRTENQRRHWAATRSPRSA